MLGGPAEGVSGRQMEEESLGLQRNLWVLFGKKRAAKDEIAAAGLVSAGFQVLANSSAIPIRNPGAS
jgi:hypothetical protein